MINLFFIVHNFSGAKTYAEELLEYLKDKVNVFLILMDDKDHKEFIIERINKITTIYIPKCIKKDLSPKYFKNIALLLYANHKNLGNTIVHVNRPEQFYLADELKKLFQCKLVYTLHFMTNFYSYIDQLVGYNSEVKITGNVLFTKMAELADRIICVTAFAKRSLVNLYNIKQEKIAVIYNGIKMQLRDPDNHGRDKKLYGFRAEERIILYAGQLDERKGIDKIIQAFLLVKDKFPETRLVIAGTGNYDNYNYLAQNCTGRVHFTGKLDKNTLINFYNFSEVGILPSQFEQCSYVAIEMMYYGLPLIISDVPGLNELVIHKKTGLICKIKPHGTNPNALEADEFDLALQIEYLLNHPDISKKIGMAAIENANIQHSFGSMGEKTMRVYMQTFTNTKAFAKNQN